MHVYISLHTHSLEGVYIPPWLGIMPWIIFKSLIDVRYWALWVQKMERLPHNETLYGTKLSPIGGRQQFAHNKLNSRNSKTPTAPCGCCRRWWASSPSAERCPRAAHSGHVLSSKEVGPVMPRVAFNLSSLSSGQVFSMDLAFRQDLEEEDESCA